MVRETSHGSLAVVEAPQCLARSIACDFSYRGKQRSGVPKKNLSTFCNWGPSRDIYYLTPDHLAARTLSLVESHGCNLLYMQPNHARMLLASFA